MNPEISSVVLGSGPYSHALSLVFGSLQISDSWLTRGAWGISSPFKAPLLHCENVFQAVSPSDQPAMTFWRQHRFWSLYGKLGGRDLRAKGLKWLVIQYECGLTDGAIPQLSAGYKRLSTSEGLMAILTAQKGAESFRFESWNDTLLADAEWKVRKQIFERVSSGPRIEAVRQEILACATRISPLFWERYSPPPQHSLANRIRSWLSTKKTDSVTPWFEMGEDLLSQTNLS